MKQISHSLRTFSPRLRRGLQGGAALGLVAAMGACDTQRFVGATDPDIISPELVTSAAAADALRLGVLGRFNVGTTGGEGMFLYSGMLTDEFESGDTFIERNQMDQRSVQIENANLDGGYRAIQRIRVGAQQAQKALRDYDAQGAAWKKAEMYMVEGYALNLLAEHFCSGVPLSSVVDGIEQPGAGVTTAAMYALALAKYDSALALLPASATTADDNRVRNIVRIERGRTLINLNRPADAAASVTGVPTNFVWLQEHNAAVRDNAVWSLNISGRRYLVGDRESGEGLNFFSANDPRLPTCLGGDTRCRQSPPGLTNTVAFNNQPGMRAQLIWDERADPVALVTGIQARLIEAEAALRGTTPANAVTILNSIRSSITTLPGVGGAISLPALTDPGTQEGRIDLLFRERAFWNWGLGQRLGDLRRLVRQYNRPASAVFPSGAYGTSGLNYGTDVNFPIPQSERNNPAFGQEGACVDRNA
jgi:hypothetical protein